MPRAAHTILRTGHTREAGPRYAAPTRRALVGSASCAGEKEEKEAVESATPTSSSSDGSGSASENQTLTPRSTSDLINNPITATFESWTKTGNAAPNLPEMAFSRVAAEVRKSFGNPVAESTKSEMPVRSSSPPWSRMRKNDKARLAETTIGSAALCAVGVTASRARSSSNRTSLFLDRPSSLSLSLSIPINASRPGRISPVRTCSRSPRLGLSVDPRADPISKMAAAMAYTYALLATESAAYSLKWRRTGRASDAMGTTRKRSADDSLSLMRGVGGDVSPSRPSFIRTTRF